MNKKYDLFVEECFKKTPKMKWGDPIFINFKDIAHGVSLHFEKDIDPQKIFEAIEGEINDSLSGDLLDTYLAIFEFVRAVGYKVALNIVESMNDIEFGKFDADGYSDTDGNFDCGFDLEWTKVNSSEYKARLYPEYA